MLTLRPPWVSVFSEENVTLWCEGAHLPGDYSTQWILNGTAIQTLTPSYSIIAASVNDIGEYRCQIGFLLPSDPIQLEVHRGKYGMERRAGVHKVFLCVFSFLGVRCVCVCVCV